MKPCFFQALSLPFGSLLLLEWDSALIALCPPEQVQKQWKKLPGEVPLLEQETPLLQEAAQQLEDYFSGKRQQFSLPLCPLGTDFQQQVWQQLLTIPYGKTITYGAIADQLQSKAFQAIGNAVGANPLPIFIPCHRVLPANGKIGNFSLIGGASTKALLLDLEGAPYIK